MMVLMSRLTQSIHLYFGLPRFLLTGGTISRVFLPAYSWSRLLTCPPHLNLAFLHLSVTFSTLSCLHPVQHSWLNDHLVDLSLHVWWYSLVT